MRTIIITAYSPIEIAIAGEAYSQQLEAPTTMKLQNDPRTQFWIDINKEISKWIHQLEQIILMEDCNSEASEVNTWMETQVLTNKICNLHGHSNAPITYQ